MYNHTQTLTSINILLHKKQNKTTNITYPKNMITDQQHKQTILKQIANLNQQWSNISIQQLQIQRMSGITNQTYKVSHPKIKYGLIYRKFSNAQTNLFLDREKQQYIYQHLSDNKIGPTIHGISQTIRLQQFIQSKVLKTKQMLTKQIIQKLAYSLNKFHQINPKSIIPKQSFFKTKFTDPNLTILKICKQKMSLPIFTQQQQVILKILSKWVNVQEINFVKNIIQELEKQELVFSHNDLLPGNVLISNHDQNIIFIDYQYAGYNYRVYDIANYFNQAAINYNVNQNPYFKPLHLSQEQEKMKDYFIRCYALASNNNSQQYTKKIQDKAELTQNQHKMYKNIKDNLILAVMLSHLMWGYWAVIVSKNPLIDFDYVKFALLRLEDYHKAKEVYLNNLNK